VAGGTGEAGEGIARDGINDRRHDDGNRGGRSLCGLARWRTIRHDDVYLETDQVGSEAGETVVVPLRPSGLDLDILIFHIAELVQAFPQCLEQDGQVAGFAIRVRRGGRRQKTDSEELSRLLRPTGERNEK